MMMGGGGHHGCIELFVHMHACTGPSAAHIAHILDDRSRLAAACCLQLPDSRHLPCYACHGGAADAAREQLLLLLCLLQSPPFPMVHCHAMAAGAAPSTINRQLKIITLLSTAVGTAGLHALLLVACCHQSCSAFSSIHPNCSDVREESKAIWAKHQYVVVPTYGAAYMIVHTCCHQSSCGRL